MPATLVRTLTAAAVTALTCAFLPGIAFAHTGIGPTNGFAAGLAHPPGGLDHVLAMVGVGLLAATLGGRALWAVPTAFVGAMALAAVAALRGVGLPFVEVGIAASVVALGLALLTRARLPLLLTAALVGGFALFHGHAHGLEMPPDGSGLAYGAGFVIATIVLHGLGIGLGLLMVGKGRLGRGLVRAGGGAMTVAGLAMLSGAL